MVSTLPLFLVLLLLACSAVGLRSQDRQPFCPDRHSQRDLDLDKLQGRWYVVEIVQHHGPEDTVPTVIDSCPELRLSRPGDSWLRLLWDEPAGALEYNFHIPVENSPGLWIATGLQNGSMAEQQHYAQFHGTVLVIKAVKSHMVLTFCSKPDQQLFSVLASRTTALNRTDVRSINGMLDRRGLRLGPIRETCHGAGAAAAGVAVAMLFWLLAAVRLC